MNTKEQFVAQELEAWGEDLEREMRKALLGLRVGDTGELSKSIRAEVLKATSGSQGKLLLHFLGYGRMVDIGTGRGGRGVLVESRVKNRQAWRGRRPRKFYSKTAYGMLNGLIERLISSYQLHTTDTIKVLEHERQRR